MFQITVLLAGYLISWKVSICSKHLTALTSAVISILLSKKVLCYFNLSNLHDRKDGNSWSSGPAPPPPPGTPPATRNNRNHKSGSNSSPSDGGSGGGSSKSGIGGGGIAGIVISILIVGAIVAFFLVKRRSKRSSSDIEKLDNEPFAPLASNEVQGNTHSLSAILHTGTLASWVSP